MLHSLLVPIVAIILLHTSSIAAMEAVGNVDKIYFSKKYIKTLVVELLAVDKSLINDKNILEKFTSSEIKKVVLKQIIEYQSDDNLLLLARRAQILGNLKELKSEATRDAKIKLNDTFSGYYQDVQILYEKEQELARKAMRKVLHAKTMDSEAKYKRLKAFLRGIEATAFAQSLRVVSNTKSYYLFDGRHYLRECTDNKDLNYTNCGDIALFLRDHISGLMVAESYFYGEDSNFAHMFNIYSGDDFILIIDGYNGKIQILETGKEKKINAKELSINYLGDWINAGVAFTGDKDQELSNQIYADINRVLSETKMGEYLDKDNNQEIVSFAYALIMHRFLWLPDLAESEMKVADQTRCCFIKLLATGRQQNWLREADEVLIKSGFHLYFVLINECEELGGQVKFCEDKVIIDLSQEQGKKLVIFINENNINEEYNIMVNNASIFEVKVSDKTDLKLTE